VRSPDASWLGVSDRIGGLPVSGALSEDRGEIAEGRAQVAPKHATPQRMWLHLPVPWATKP